MACFSECGPRDRCARSGADEKGGFALQLCRCDGSVEGLRLHAPLAVGGHEAAVGGADAQHHGGLFDGVVRLCRGEDDRTVVWLPALFVHVRE
jgi:hypothetical protein